MKIHPVLFGAACMVGCADRGPDYLADTFIEGEALTATWTIGALEVADGGDSGAVHGRVVDPHLAMVVEGLEGDDCATSLVLYAPWSPYERDGEQVRSLPLDPAHATLGHPDLTFRGTDWVRSEAAVWTGGRYTLRPLSESYVWDIDIEVDTVCLTDSDDAEHCAPPDAPIPLHTRASRFDGQATVPGAEAARFFDVVPSPDWTFEGVALPPCVPRPRW